MHASPQAAVPAGGGLPGLRAMLRQVALYAPSAVVPAGLGLVFAAVFTRVLTSEDFGRYSLAMSAAGFAAAVATQWLQQGVTRFLPGTRSAEEDTLLRGAVTRGLGLVAGLTLVAGSAVALAVWAFGGGGWLPWVVAAVASAVVTSSFTVLMTVLQAGMRAGRFTSYKLVEGVVRFAASVVLVAGLRWRAEALVWASVLSAAVLLPWLWRDAALPGLRAVLGDPRHRAKLRTLAAYGTPMVGWYLAALLLDVGDRYLIQLFRGSAEVGIYAANYGLVYGAVGLLAAPMLLAAHPFLMRAWGEGRRDEVAKWLGRIAEWYIVAGVLLAGGLWLVGRDLTAVLLGLSFREGWVILAPVGAGLSAWQLGMYTHKPLEFAGRTRTMLGAALAAASANLLLNAALLPVFGYVAAAWTTLVCYVAYAAVSYRLGVTELRWRIHLSRILPVTAAIVVALVAGGWMAALAGRAAGPGAAMATRLGWFAAVATVVMLREWQSSRAPWGAA